ncbi:MAG: gamma-glutamylcyclotransferase [Proteobacteria bacterium]|nr:gamma-glutamylcyclotransferase [Pseudomonadota bacterium]
MTYFAYANLLDIDRMRSMAPSATPLGIMTLPGYRLAFAWCQGRDMGGATLRKEQGATLYGVNYAMSDEDLVAMDKASLTHLNKWRRMPVTVFDEAGKAHETSTYFIPDAEEGVFTPPLDNYVLPMRKGMKAYGFPVAYQTQLESLLATGA